MRPEIRALGVSNFDVPELEAASRALSREQLACNQILYHLGERGVEQMFPIIYPPQVAIVAFGKVMPRPWIVGDRVEPRTVASVTVSADHRAVDGRRAGQFLAAIDRWLQQPEQL